MKNVCAIVATYNGENDIDCCLKSLYASEHPVSVICVDNSSTDKTTQIIKDSYPDTELVCLTDNLGFGAANNLGIKQALEHGPDHLFLLNQDAWIKPDTITNLLRSFEAVQDCGIMSPIHLCGEEDRLDARFSGYISKSDKLFNDLLLSRELQPAYPLPFVNAAAWLVPAGVMRTVGGFDPIFFHRGEDTNFVDRIHYQNLSVFVAPEAFICHKRPQALPASNVMRARQNFRKPLRVFADPNTPDPYQVGTVFREAIKLVVRHLIGGHFGMFRFDTGPMTTCRLAWNSYCVMRHLKKRPRTAHMSFLEMEPADYLTACRYGK